MTPGVMLAVGVLGRGVVDPDEPLIHADDVGLLRGLAVFETVRVYGGHPFAWEAHLDRLERSAARLGMGAADRGAVTGLAEAVVARAGLVDCALRLTLTGGREGDQAPVLIVSAGALPDDLEKVRRNGIKVISLPLGIDPDLRRDAPWLLDGVKSTSYAVNMAAWAEARRRGADDAIFLAAGGVVLEGPVTNVWWRHGRTLRTPALELGILAGVTRATLIGLARDAGYEVQEGRYPVADLAAGDEAFTSSSVREVMPIVALDGRPLGVGSVGSAAAGLQAALRRAAGSPLG
jgi:4-amino-4-deoxychorismate lyase